jgi:hypothetical protein
MTGIMIRRIGGKVAFVPDGGKPGGPLEVDRGEGVTWNNRTNQPHWPWPIDAQGNLLSEAESLDRQLYLCDRIPAHDVSDPAYNVDPKFSPQPEPPPQSDVPPPTINYVCKLHREERGSIVIRNP